MCSETLNSCIHTKNFYSFTPFPVASSDVWPSFDGTSHLALPIPAGLASSTSLDLLIQPSAGDGLILYAGVLGGEGGDFLAVGLAEQRIVVRINLGRICSTATDTSLYFKCLYFKAASTGTGFFCN